MRARPSHGGFAFAIPSCRLVVAPAPPFWESANLPFGGIAVSCRARQFPEEARASFGSARGWPTPTATLAETELDEREIVAN